MSAGTAIAAPSWAPRVKNGDSWFEIVTKNMIVTIEPLSNYCNLGNFYANVVPRRISPIYAQLQSDLYDSFPRYYFDLDCARREMENWLKKRGEL